LLWVLKIFLSYWGLGTGNWAKYQVNNADCLVCMRIIARNGAVVAVSAQMVVQADITQCVRCLKIFKNL